MKKKQRVASSVLASVLAYFLVIPGGLAAAILNVADPGVTDVLYTGPTAYQQGNLGTSQAVGDFNGDGIDDLAIGAPGMNSPSAITRVGNIYIYYGGVGMNSLPEVVNTGDSQEDAMLYGTDASERAGDIMTVGDFNNDGADDLVIVGQYGVDGAGTVDVTRISIVFGRFPPAPPIIGTQSLAAVAGTVIERAVGPIFTTLPHFQVSAITAGDLNNDNYDDLILSDKVFNEFRILMGAASWPAAMDLQTDTDFVLKHSGDTNLLSSAYFPLYNQVEIAGVAAGDLNGDNIDDLAMGVPNETVGGSLTNAGRVYVIYGGTNFNPGPSLTSITINTANDIVISGGKVSDKAGGPLAMGNINGDAFTDLVIGEPRSQQGVPGSTDLGQVQVLFGGNALGSTISLLNEADMTLRLRRQLDEGGVGRIGFKTGQALLAQDANGDGTDDIVISSPGAFFNNGDNGWVHVVYGGAALPASYFLDLTADAWFRTPEPVGPALVSGRMGESLALGDLDNDGRPDIGMGAPAGAPDATTGAGFLPLLFKPASTVACSGVNAQVTTDYPFSNGDFLCLGENTLTTIGAVTIQSTATATFQSPSITLGNGFRVQSGAGFTAGI